ncbi:MAG: hypothetical protein ABA06_00090 [Parcubacteria bacterium C7867-001]|nr:MAG: hypothetical protein ABA06_00090 [Parcubacteria bacterium C7867-001]
MQRGFTLIEILLIIAALAILIGSTVIAINPARQLGDARNGERRVDVGAVYSAVRQYAFDNHGAVPAEIPTGTLSNCTDAAPNAAYTICRTESCSGSIELTELLTNEKYLAAIPNDPSNSDANLSGYKIIRDTDHNDRVTVCAPLAENDELIYLPE